MNSNSHPVHPCANGPQAPALYTYYVIMSLLVVILTISIVWFPFVQLIGEFNVLIIKLVLFINRELLGNHFPRFFDSVEKHFLSQQTLIMISLFCVTYMMYLASWDLLAFAGCYISTLPNHKYIKRMKKKALRAIEYLIRFSVKKRYVKFNRKVTLMYYNPKKGKLRQKPTKTKTQLSF